MGTAKVVRLPSCLSLSSKTSLEPLRGHSPAKQVLSRGQFFCNSMNKVLQESFTPGQSVPHYDGQHGR